MPGKVNSKDGFDYAADYVSTSRGAWDLFRVLREPLYHLETFVSLSQGSKELMQKAMHVLTGAGTALSLPKMICDTNALRKSVQQVQSATACSYKDRARPKKIADSHKNLVTCSLNLTNTAAEAGLFLHHVKIVIWSIPQFRLLSIIYNASSLFSDGIDFISQGHTLEQLQKEIKNARRPKEKAAIEARETLTHMTRAQDISGVGIASIGLGVDLFKTAIESIPIVSGLSLGLGFFWLAIKISCHFYEVMTVQPAVSIAATSHSFSSRRKH